MILRNLIGRTGRGLALGAATFATVGLTAMAVAPKPAHAISPGVAAGIGLGAFALGTAVTHPYYAYGYPYGPYAYGPPAYPAYPAYACDAYGCY